MPAPSFPVNMLADPHTVGGGLFSCRQTTHCLDMSASPWLCYYAHLTCGQWPTYRRPRVFGSRTAHAHGHPTGIISGAQSGFLPCIISGAYGAYALVLSCKSGASLGLQAPAPQATNAAPKAIVGTTQARKQRLAPLQNTLGLTSCTAPMPPNRPPPPSSILAIKK